MSSTSNSLKQICAFTTFTPAITNPVIAPDHGVVKNTIPKSVTVSFQTKHRIPAHIRRIFTEKCILSKYVVFYNMMYEMGIKFRQPTLRFFAFSREDVKLTIEVSTTNSIYRDNLITVSCRKFDPRVDNSSEQTVFDFGYKTPSKCYEYTRTRFKSDKSRCGNYIDLGAFEGYFPDYCRLVGYHIPFDNSSFDYAFERADVSTISPVKRISALKNSGLATFAFMSVLPARVFAWRD